MKKVAAAFTLFTRIPIWKFMNIPQEVYSSAVVFWPLTGWFTGGLMALCIIGFSFIFPISVCIILSIIVRLLLTGALHEDGLADFCDGFGGGRNKESTLRIMKDSFTGAYGVIGLICYFLLLWSLLTSLPAYIAAVSIFVSDPFSKACASQTTNILPYARPNSAKNKITYSIMSMQQLLINLAFGILPLILLAFISPYLLLSIILPAVGVIIMIMLMKRRIGGYTGDCCGATFLICEILMLSGIDIIYNL